MDIDIDFLNRNDALRLFEHTVASRIEKDEIKPHNTGVYVTAIPKDVRNNLATIDYKTAEDRGYMKIDFLNVGIYEGVRSEEHLISLINQEPLWDLLEQDEFANLLFHLNGYGGILRQMKPCNIDQLAAVLAMIRPAKRYLIGKDWITVMNEIWTKTDRDDVGYAFRKSHAYAYAMAIMVQMNLICEQAIA
jgi:DNA polymerase III alpha subunit